MMRLSEEQRAILSCYSGNREEVIAELRYAIQFIEDAGLREESEDLLARLEKLKDSKFEEENEKKLMVSFKDWS